MARLLVLVATLVLAAVVSEACTSSSSSSTPASSFVGGEWDYHTDTDSIFEPTYDPSTGAVGIQVTFPFKRGTENGKLQVFKKIDASGDSYIEACEWSMEGGSVKNFVEFLTDDDVDGDEKISWEEFQKVTV
ncbi:hypothetical protein HOLleu_34961 [Holothuria leucospilota]|uniref:Regeneration associated protein n=1 Tax=Holothuria leucospilota TaxID=206669 RepID=A0A9Q0YLZ7_HOLLE|nr:hypothetical protein HOLleu_34961 [Holothuria leucospilota]